MIDTWTRHLAAVGEARRLLGLVLQNNPAFRAYGGAGESSAGTAPVPPELAQDPQFTAYVHLNKALAALQPIPSAGEVCAQSEESLPDQISEIKPERVGRGEGVVLFRPVAPEGVPKTDTCDLAQLRARLKFVLEAAPEDIVAVPVGWCATGEEAQVAIVRTPTRDMAARGAV